VRERDIQKVKDLSSCNGSNAENRRNGEKPLMYTMKENKPPRKETEAHRRFYGHAMPSPSPPTRIQA